MNNNHAPLPTAGLGHESDRRRFWILSLSSYSLIHAPNRAVQMRRIAMLTIISLRTTMSALSILSAITRGSIEAIVINCCLAALSFWFTATCLAIIGDAAGDSRVKGVVVQQWYFDAFLGSCVIIHAVLIIAWFLKFSDWGLQAVSISMWLAILSVAWIAGGQFELPSYQSSEAR